MSTPRNRANLEQILRQVVELNDKVMAIESKGMKVTWIDWERIWEKIIKALKQIIDAIRNFLKLKVITSIEQASYETTVEIDGDIKTEFPKELNPDVFKRHNELVTSALEIRKGFVEKIIDVIVELLRSILQSAAFRLG